MQGVGALNPRERCRKLVANVLAEDEGMRVCPRILRCLRALRVSKAFIRELGSKSLHAVVEDVWRGQDCAEIEPIVTKPLE